MGKTAFSLIVPRSIFALLVLLALAAMPRAAAADEQAAVKKVTNLNMKAIEAYNKQDYETARTLLKEALELCAASGLDRHPIRARTHVHFGIVAIVGFKQREVGLKQFRKALEVQPDIKLTKQLTTPELQDAFEEAVLAGDGGGGGAATAGGEPSVDADAPRADAEGGDDDGDRPPARKPPPRKKRPGDEDGDKDEDEGGAQTGSFFVALSAGTGLGVASGSGELDPNAHKLDSAGFAMAQLAHIAPEVGYYVLPDLLISAQLRLQYVNGLNGKMGMGCGTDNFCTPGSGALAGFAKVTYLMGTSPFRLTVGGQIGGGNIRHAVVFPDSTCKASATSTTMQSCVDTLPGGPFLVGPTFGFIYEIGSSFDFIVAVNSALGVPNFTFNLDINAGVGFRI